MTNAHIRNGKKALFYVILLIIIFFQACTDAEEAEPSVKLEIQQLLTEGDALLLIDSDAALSLAQKASIKADQNQFPSLELDGLVLQGRIYAQKGADEKVQETFKEVLGHPLIDKERGYQKALSHYFLGRTDLNENQYLSAIINLRKVLTYTGDSDPYSIFGSASEMLGDLFYEINYFKNASSYYHKALKYHKQFENEAAYFKIAVKLGRVYSLDEKLNSADSIFQNALTFYQEQDDQKQIAALYQEKAEIALTRKDYEASLKLASLVTRIALELSELELLLSAYYTIGTTHLQKHNLIEAKNYLLKSEELFDILPREPIGPDLYKNLAAVFEKTNNAQKSIFYYRKYQQLTESVLLKNKVQKGKDLLSAIRQDKNRKEIAALKKRNDVVEKYSTLRAQDLGSNRSFIILLTAFVIVFILLVALYYKRFTEKKKVSKQLEKTVKERTAALNQTLQKLSFHVNNTTLSVIELNASEDISGWSAQSEKIFGWSEKQLLGKKFLEAGIFHEKSQPLVQKIFEKIRKEKISKKFIQTQCYSSAGDNLFIEWNFSVLYEGDTIMSVLCFANNVTHREKALQETETAKKELDNFIYKTSHDVKGPIARIEGLINLGMMEAKEEVSQTYFQMLNQVASNFNIVLSRLFRIHGIYNHELELAPLNLSNEIKALLGNLQKKNALYSLQYKVEMDDALIWNTDKLLLYIIVQNIYENALDYRMDGLSMIVFSAEVIPNKKQLRLLIRDNGTCIPLQAADRIFDMFFQNTAQSHTAGLGLYMVKKSVEKLGGTIRLLEEEKETVFEIFLPTI